MMRFPFLDILRSVAMIEVLCGHFRNVLFPSFQMCANDSTCENLCTSVLFILTKWGRESVIVFFILSGFLVGGGGLEKLRGNVGTYCRKRFLRIFPPLFFASIMLIFVFHFVGVQIPWRRWFLNLLCLQGVCCDTLLGPWWALSVEVWFYVFGGAVMSSLFCRGWVRSFGVAMLILSIFVFSKLSFAYLLIWIMGAILYFTRVTHFNTFRFFVSLLLGACVIVLGESMVSLPRLKDVLIAIGFCAIVREGIVWKPTGLVSTRIFRISAFFSRISYSAYLSHMIVMIALTNFLFTVSSNATVDREYMNLHGSGILPVFSKVGVEEFCWYSISVVLALVFGWLVSVVSERDWVKQKEGGK